jgi:DNA repair exonuclease SbcCD ATPase subunit
MFVKGKFSPTRIDYLTYVSKRRSRKQQIFANFRVSLREFPVAMSAQTNKHRQPEKNPQKARSSWRRPSQTTRILENIEWLISLHETRDGEEQGELAQLLERLESWKKETHQRLEETNSLVGEVEKQTSQHLAQQLDVKAKDIIQAVESQLGERIGKLDRCVSEIAEKVGKWQDTAPNLNSNSEAHDRAVTELLGRQSQNIEARLERFLEQIDKKTESARELASLPGGDFQNESQIENRLEELGQKISKIAELVELQVYLPVGGGSDGDEAMLVRQVEHQKRDLVDNIQQVSDRFDQKNQELARTIQCQFEEQLEMRFEKLNEHVNKITSALAGQQALLESANTSKHTNDEAPAGMDQLDKKIEGIFLSFNARIDDLFGSLGNRISQFSEGITKKDPIPMMPPVAPSDKETASHWHRQKAAMLSKYGIDPDYRPLKDVPDNSAKAVEPDVQLEEATEQLESLHNSIENISAADAEAIENLKEELTSKLRDAEIEFSINRAKLSQLKAELDGKQVELDRRAAALAEKYGDSKSTETKSGFLDRLTRHLSLRKIEPLGD